MTENLESLRELRHVLVRLGARQAGRYWSSAVAVFTRNLFGGACVGAVASVVAAVLLGLDAHRGPHSLLYHVLRTAQAIVATVSAQIQQELR